MLRNGCAVCIGLQIACALLARSSAIRKRLRLAGCFLKMGWLLAAHVYRPFFIRKYDLAPRKIGLSVPQPESLYVA